MNRGFYIIFLFLLVSVQSINTCQIDSDQGDDIQGESSFVCYVDDSDMDSQFNLDENEEDSLDTDFLFLLVLFTNNKPKRSKFCQDNIFYYSLFLYHFTDSSPPSQA